MRNRLRLFPGEDAAPIQTPPAVHVKLGEILQPLADAAASNRTFVSDFLDEDVQISSDLYEVLMAYANVRRAA